MFLDPIQLFITCLVSFVPGNKAKEDLVKLQLDISWMAAAVIFHPNVDSTVGIAKGKLTIPADVKGTWLHTRSFTKIQKHHSHFMH